MGGPSGGNGGGNSDKKTEFGYSQPKSTIEKVGDFIKGGGFIGAVARSISKSSKSKNKGSKSGDTYSGEAYGYNEAAEKRDTVKDARTGKDNDGGNNNNQKSIEQPKVASQMDNTDVKSDLITADKTAPTDIEMTEDEKLIARKRGRKTKTILTSVVGDKSNATLSKKTLLG